MKRTLEQNSVKELALTAIDDTDFQILLNLNLEDLRAVSQTCRHLSALYYNDKFWNLKVITEFGTEIAQAKPRELGFWQQYMDLRNITLETAVEMGRVDVAMHTFTTSEHIRYGSIRQAYAKGHLDMLKYLQKHTQSYNNAFIISAIEHGHTHVVNWLISEKFAFKSVHLDAALKYSQWEIAKYLLSKQIRPTTNGADYAVIHGQENISKHMLQLRPPVGPTQNGADVVASKGGLRRLDWLASLNPAVLPSRLAADTAIKQGNLQILNWLKEKSIHPTPECLKVAACEGNLERIQFILNNTHLRPSRKMANCAAKNGHLTVLYWLHSNLINGKYSVLPDQSGLTKAALNGHSAVVMWLAEKGVYPEFTAMNYIVTTGNLELLKALGAVPNEIGANIAVENGYIHILNWLVTLSPPVYPTRSSYVQTALTKNYLETYEWVEKHCPEILPKRFNIGDVNRAACNGSVSTLDWFACGNYKGKKMLPDIAGIQWAAANGHLAVLRWARKQGIAMNSSVASVAIHKGQFKVIKWLVKQSIFPTITGVAQAVLADRFEIIEWMYNQKLINPFKLLEQTETSYNSYPNTNSSSTRKLLLSKLPIHSAYKRCVCQHYLKHINNQSERKRALSWYLL